jgi:hypothetical protein
MALSSVKYEDQDFADTFGKVAISLFSKARVKEEMVSREEISKIIHLVDSHFKTPHCV